MADLCEKRLVVVAGKGGVGKTTIAYVVGLCAATMGKRVLVCLTKAMPRYSDFLGGIVLSSEIHKVSANLHIVNLSPVAAREEYGMMVLRQRTLHRLIFGSTVVKAFLDAAPGLSEWAVFGKATFHALNSVNGEPEYDMVVFDSPATGHGLDMLTLPEVIYSTIPKGRMKEEALERIELLKDGARTEILPVTIPEEMPVNEALELVEELKKKRFPVERIVVNMVQADICSEELISRIESQACTDDLPDGLIPSAWQVNRYKTQKTLLELLSKKSGLKMIHLPTVLKEKINEIEVRKLARLFFDSSE